MKRSWLLIFIGIFVLSSNLAFTQRASDFYLPLCVGNYLQFHSSDRTTTHSIIRSDSIAGHKYFLEMRSEVMTETGETNNYHNLWIREDSSGSIVVGAVGVKGSTNLDSATILDPPGYFFSNGCIVPGNTVTYSSVDYTWIDTTMSNTETVQASAGTFLNCIKIRETKYQTSNDSIVFIEYTYYAQGVGIVKVQREGSSILDLVSYSAITPVSTRNDPNIASRYVLYQNYPNPFNPTTTICYGILSSSRVSLKIYNILGEQIADLVNTEQSAGWYEAIWNAKVSSGLYFYRLDAVSTADPDQRFTQLKKMLLLK